MRNDIETQLSRIVHTEDVKNHLCGGGEFDSLRSPARQVFLDMIINIMITEETAERKRQRLPEGTARRRNIMAAVVSLCPGEGTDAIVSP